jgi:hypothetical protein
MLNFGSSSRILKERCFTTQSGENSTRTGKRDTMIMIDIEKRIQ